MSAGAGGRSVAHAAKVVSEHVRGEREPAADDLAEGGQIRHDAVVLLGAPVGEAEAGDDLVEDQRHAVPRGDLPYALEEAGLRHHQPLQRLHDHRGQVVVMRLDHGLGLGHVVEGRDQDLALDGVGNARRVRGGGGERLGRPGPDAHQGVVVDAVEAALELEDLVALPEGARHAEREEGRLAAAAAETDLLGARDGPAELLGEGQGRLAELEVRRALAELGLDRGDHRGMGMAQHEGAAAQDVVNVLAAREVIEPRPPGLAHDEGQLLRGVVSPQDASGEHPHRRLEQRFFFRTAASRTCHSTSLRCGDWTVLYRKSDPGRKGRPYSGKA